MVEYQSPGMILFEIVCLIVSIGALLRIILTPPYPPAEREVRIHTIHTSEWREVQAPPAAQPPAVPAAPERRAISSPSWTVSGMASDLPKGKAAPAPRQVTSSAPERISGPGRKELGR